MAKSGECRRREGERIKVRQTGLQRIEQRINQQRDQDDHSWQYKNIGFKHAAQIAAWGGHFTRLPSERLESGHAEPPDIRQVCVEGILYEMPSTGTVSGRTPSRNSPCRSGTR